MTLNPLSKAILAGMMLGVVCIVGASLRASEPLSGAYLFAFWFNRVLMGLLIGVFPLPKKAAQRLMVGAGLGLFVSFAFFSATEFYDLMGFLVGAPYGMIIVSVMDFKKIRFGQNNRLG